MHQTPGSRPKQFANAHKLAYTGKTKDLFRIFFQNLGLTVLTLGAYRFWGKIRMRRYLAAHLLFQGEPFGYAGSGREVFFGFLRLLFLLAMPLILLLKSVSYLTTLAVIEGTGLSLMVTVFSPCVIFWVRRYRLSRSQWRGIFFYQKGNAFVYAKKSLAGGALNLLTLFWYVPKNARNLLDYQINRIYFGTMPFRYEGTAEDIRMRWNMDWAARKSITARRRKCITRRPQKATTKPFMIMGWPARRAKENRRITAKR